MKKELYFIVTFLLLIAEATFAQKQEQKRIDSLQTSLKKSVQDTNKVNILTSLSEHSWRKNNYDDALTYAEDALQLAKKLRFKKGEAVAYNNIGLAYYYQDNYSEARKNYVIAIEIFEAIGAVHETAWVYNSVGQTYYYQGNYSTALKNYFKARELFKNMGDKHGEATCYINIGIVYLAQGNYSEASKSFFVALKIQESINNQDGMATCYKNIGDVYLAQRDYPEALKNYFASLEIREALDNKYGMAYCRIGIGVIYYHQGNYTEALENYFTALELFRTIGNKVGIARSYINIGCVYSAQDSYPEAQDNYSAALEIQEAIGDKYGIAEAFISIGSLYVKTGDVEKGKIWLQKGLEISRELNIKKKIKEGYKGLVKADSILGNYKSAFENHKMYMLYHDSLSNEENTKILTQTAIQYEFDKKEVIAKAEQERIEAEMRFRYSLFIGGTGLIAIIGFVLYRNIRLKRRKEKEIFIAGQQIIELEKEKIESELHQAKKDIHQFVRKVDEKNELINKIYDELHKLNNLYDTEKTELKNTLVQLKSTSILTDDDWKSFQAGFNKIYPFFVIKVKKEYPTITTAELRFLMLAKIGLSTGQMADALGVSANSVRVTWRRVKNKLNGTLEDTPQTLLSRIDEIQITPNVNAL
ncbi:MAG: tetratricopeptide repeat protein [Flavobacteriaceae bacterium]